MTIIKESKQLTIYQRKDHYSVYINGMFISAHNYIPLFEVLENGYVDADYVSLYINSRGGSSAVGIQIANSIRSSQLHIECHIVGACDSAATMVALSGNTLDLKNCTCMYFHNWSQEVRASGKEIKLFIENQDRKISTAFKHFYSPFLTDQELEHLANDGEIYIHADDPSLPERIERHFN